MGDNSAFTAETAAKHQAELNDYINSKDINPLFIQIVEGMLIEKPDNPIAFIISFLQKKYPDQANVGGAPAVASESVTNLVQTGEEDEEADSEDDEDDYVDELPVMKPKAKTRQRNSIMGESNSGKTMADVPVFEKSPKTKAKITQLLSKSMLFSRLFAHLDENQMQALVGAMEEKEFTDGDEIIKQGDDGDYFYVIEKGTAVALKDGTIVKEYTEGGSFGELAIMYNAPRAATCKATSNCTVWRLQRVAFKVILMETQNKKREQHKNFLQDMEIFKDTLNEYEILTVADSLVEETFKSGEVICRQGDTGHKFYIVKQGEAVCSQIDAAGEAVEVATLNPGGYFGEVALLQDSRKRQATVTARDTLVVLSMDRDTFTRLLGPFLSVLKRNVEQYNKFVMASV
mmetsp:Transcript_40638/g.55350  ORF Transcript_40638/g.55350 Transcript_40638/m.55350 type:complete len:402 (-) Transcript_40638:347-1552(-)|eukprot:CAMPEP_0185769472 /NCGR_PEP_ID=MMETSP1174-20130828/54176_1 /TAXON_ID=35687 /ORGANISM="Dictyocha speculum, Strain CCMP1381" /LENGTH=401 /DNA_ID=CAMNT_0028454549 /DNA_START=60 /DNA_END=1265 /DNA_ORIENTATION=-